MDYMAYMAYMSMRILLVYLWMAFIASDIPSSMKKQVVKEFCGIFLIYILLEFYIYYLFKLIKGF